jgi:carbonic anhydrase
MSKATDGDVHTLAARQGVDTRSLEFHTVPDQDAALRHDLLRIRTSPFLPAGMAVGGAIYDVHTGKLMPVEL